jgi:8-amino-7-oxononanoate synthase
MNGLLYEKELDIILRSNRLRQRNSYNHTILDLGSNDYLALASQKTNIKKAYKLLQKEKYYAPKASLLVNGYSNLHKEFEQELCLHNGFEDGIIVGSGFLANIALIESMIRKKDYLFIDEDYHASGILATKLIQGTVIPFRHNDTKDLEQKIKKIKKMTTPNRIIIAIEGVYSMGGDIAKKEFTHIAKTHNSILIVDEAHSSGVIGSKLNGWFDYHNIKIEPNHIKMGTLGKAYGSYGAYILASKHIIKFLENRAKPIIYSTALSLFDVALALVNFRYIKQNYKKLKKQITKKIKIANKTLGIQTPSLILPVLISNNKKVIKIQQKLLKNNFFVGAIRQPTVPQAILRVILKLDIRNKDLKKILKLIKKEIGCK